MSTENHLPAQITRLETLKILKRRHLYLAKLDPSYLEPNAEKCFEHTRYMVAKSYGDVFR